MEQTNARLVDISSSDLYNSLLTNTAERNRRFMNRNYDSLSRQEKETIARQQGMIKDRDYTVITIPMDKKNPARELNELRLFLRGTLSKVFDKSDVDLLLTDENMNSYWMPAFTHRSYDPTPDRNYEKLEYWGDSALKLAFRNFLATTYKDLNESELSNLSNHYMSTEEQASLSSNLGLPKYIRSYVPMTRGIEEDLLESFYGALYSISGMDAVSAVTNYLYREVYIDPQYKLGSFTTRVQQALQALNLPRPKEGSISERGRLIIHLYYDDEKTAADFKSRLGIPYRWTTVKRGPDGEVKGYSIANAAGKYKGVVTANAYQNLSREFDAKKVYEKIQARRTAGIDSLLKYVQENIDPRYESVSVYRQTGDYEVTAILQGTIGKIMKTIYAVKITYNYGRAPKESEIYGLILESMQKTRPIPKDRGTRRRQQTTAESVEQVTSSRLEDEEGQIVTPSSGTSDDRSGLSRDSSSDDRSRRSTRISRRGRGRSTRR